MNASSAPRILCVCLGNICRSPMMQGALEAACAQAGLSAQCDSAGLGDWHQGDPPDQRAVAAAAARGLDISAQRARKISLTDFSDFDLILTAEEAQAEKLRRMAQTPSRAEVTAFLSFGPGGDIPDPYYGGPEGFERVLNLIDSTTPGLLTHLRDGAR